MPENKSWKVSSCVCHQWHVLFHTTPILYLASFAWLKSSMHFAIKLKNPHHSLCLVISRSIYMMRVAKSQLFHMFGKVWEIHLKTDEKCMLEIESIVESLNCAQWMACVISHNHFILNKLYLTWKQHSFCDKIEKPTSLFALGHKPFNLYDESFKKAATFHMFSWEIIGKVWEK